MRLKSYFAGTVEAAMALAREELGPEAMLVHSKKATPETRHIGHYEVVFALPDQEPAPPVSAPMPSFGSLFAAERDLSLKELSSELAALKHRIEAMTTVMAPAAGARSRVTADTRAEQLAQKLQGIDVDPLLASEIVEEVSSGNCAPDAVRESLHKRIRADATLGTVGGSRNIVALAGPPGAGKTTALVKLATRYGLAVRRSMHFISTDVFRIGGAEQLRLYASILGVGFQAVETPLALAQALEEQRRKDLVFIDTPGCANRDLPEVQELAAYIANDPDIDVHLVLAASNRACDLNQMVRRYAIFRPSKFIFTRLDETDRYGPLINQTHQTGKPVSFLSGGEQIPEDLEPATAERIADLLRRSLEPDALDIPLSIKGAN